MAYTIIIVLAVLFLIIDGGRIYFTMNEQLLAKLFRWRTKVEYNGVTFYLRVVADSVVEDARKYALLESRKMRKALRNDQSDEYLLYLDQYNDFTKEELSAFIQIAASREVMREYLANNPRPQLEDLASNPTQEELEEQEAAKEQRNTDYIKDMQDYVENWRVDFEKRLDEMSDDALRNLAKKYRADEVCENIFNREFEAYVIASSIYADDKYTKRMMAVDDYKELPTEVQQLLYNAYNNMNIAADDIKNS